jgi:RsiW-degrading membrane proteinase PrsW (M82 family)
MTAALMGLGPVVLFLGALVFLDSYKLVKLRVVVAVVACGMAVALGSYFVNGLFEIDFRTLTRYVAPVTEEFLKALIIVALLRTHRIGFLVDAAILGFAVGTGFAIVENVQYMRLMPEAGMGTWMARGLGTAIMHGGATAIFAVSTTALLDRKPLPVAVIPGFLVAVVFHSFYNHFFVSPFFSMIGIIIAFPLLLNAVFSKSEAAVGDWLGQGFDADTEMLKLINSGQLSDSPVGQYLAELKDKFQGPIVADLLCYLRLYTELALRAKGILMMRESGFEVPVDDATREKFTEMSYLEGSIGRTGLLALKPMLHMSHKDLWQLYMIGK